MMTLIVTLLMAVAGGLIASFRPAKALPPPPGGGSGSAFSLRYRCSENPPPCINDDDCAESCVEENFKCHNERCLPEPRDTELCNTELGGMRVYDRSGNYTCVCKHPHLSGDRTCSLPNVGVCEGGTLTLPGNRNPVSSDCVCPPDKRNVNFRCVPKATCEGGRADLCHALYDP